MWARFGIITLALFCVACGDSGDAPGTASPTPTPSTPQPPPAGIAIVASTNGNDPRIAALRDADGTSYIASGPRNGAGIPQRVESLSSAGTDGDFQFSFDVAGRLSAVSSTEVTMRLSYTASGSTMQATDNDGSSIDTFTENQNPVPIVRPAAASLPADGFAGPTRLAEASFRSCGAPQDGDVYFDIQGASSGVVARSVPGRQVAEGRYQADIPLTESSLNLDVRAQAMAQQFARALRSICESSQNPAELAAHCRALEALQLAPQQGFQKLGKIARACRVIAGRLSAYCAMTNRDQFTEALVASVPETLTLHAPDLRVRARLVAVPNSNITSSLPFDGSLGFSFSYDDQTVCPVLRLYNRSLGGQTLPAPGGGSVQTPRITLYYFLNGTPLAGVAQGGERTIRLRSVPPGSKLQMTGTVAFHKTIYNPDGTYSGWCPAAIIEPPGRFTALVALPRITSTSLFIGGNPICWTGSGGLVDIVGVTMG
jgi:hypothetical protein